MLSIQRCRGVLCDLDAKTIRTTVSGQLCVPNVVLQTYGDTENLLTS